MTHTNRITMKWASLLKDIKDKVRISQSPSPPATSSATTHFEEALDRREKHELELEFKRYWEEFRSSTSEKEKEAALNMAVDVFCRIMKQLPNLAHSINTLVETHIFSFVVGRAFVTDVEKLKISSKTRSLPVQKLLSFFSEVTKDGISPGSNLLYAVEVLVSGPTNKQSLLDSGILCCLIHILKALLAADEDNQSQPPINPGKSILFEKGPAKDTVQRRRLEVEGSIVHIMKALSSHPLAAQSLTEDDSLQVLFEMVKSGSLTAFALFKEGLVSLHAIQLHRHAMQILDLLLANDKGSAAKYIRKHQLIKVLLTAVKDFNPDSGDSTYTMGIIALLLECVQVSYRPEAGSIRLRDDICNAHGYQFLVQFALTLCTLHKNQVSPSANFQNTEEYSASDDFNTSSSGARQVHIGKGNSPQPCLSPSFSRLLDVLVDLAQSGPVDRTVSPKGKGSKSTTSYASGQCSSRTSSSGRTDDEISKQGNTKVVDIEAVHVLQDIFLKADCIEVQSEVLSRICKIYSSHLENYSICQQLRTVPLFILNMDEFSPLLQELILKVLEHAVTVLSCDPEQELLSLCCLLQQPKISSELKHTILSFFVKLLSFDHKYKKVVREVGFLDFLLDDLKQHKFLFGTNEHNKNPGLLERKSRTNSFKNQMSNQDATVSSATEMVPSCGKFLVFENESTISVAWECLGSLLKKSEANQSSFRSSDGPTIVLPFLASDTHRLGALRILSCLITEDASQAHPEELGALIEALKSEMVTSVLGPQYKLQNDAKYDTFGALWRILGANSSAQMVFGEATGFSLLLTTLHSFQSDGGPDSQATFMAHMKVFRFLLRVVTCGVSNNAMNRLRLHTIISSQTFYDLLFESGLVCVDCEKQVIQLLLELALELVVPPSSSQVDSSLSFDNIEESSTNILTSSLGTFMPDKEWVYNAGAVGVLIRTLLLFTPKVQLEVLNIIEKLACAGPFNQENLTSAGCLRLLLETIHPFLMGSSPLLTHALRIVEVLGAYRMSSSELRFLIRYIFRMKLINSGHILVDSMERLVRMGNMTSESVPLAPFVEMDLSKIGHASVQVSLGERTWPPNAGYSFVCWFQFHNFLTSQQTKEPEQSSGKHVLRIFSVGAIDDGNTCYVELYLHDNGVLTLATSNTCSLSFPGLELEEGRWHHLAVVHSKPSTLAGLFQASMAYLYLDGYLRHAGKLGYSPSPVGKPLQVTIGTPVTSARVAQLSWRFRCCYLFEEVLSSGSICFMYILGRGYRGLFLDTDLLQFVPKQACGGVSMAILDSLDTELPLTSNIQKLDGAGSTKSDGSGIVWDLERLGNLSLQLTGRRLICAFDGTYSEALWASGTSSMLNLVDPLSAAASLIGGIPRIGRLHGNTYIFSQCVIGDSIRTVGGMPVVLALVEASETKDMLHMALALLECVLKQSPSNVHDMQAYRGYHLLALFLQRKMSLFDMHALEIFFQIAACEASFSEPQKLQGILTVASPVGAIPEANYDDFSSPKFTDELLSVGSRGDLDDFSLVKDSFSQVSELDNGDIHAGTSNCIVLSNADMVEHVLLDWTLWVNAPVSIQIALVGFLEQLVSIHWYRNHNLTLLRQIKLVEHLLVTMQREDVEVPVLEKLVVLLSIILKDGFLASELEHVVRFVIMTFDPPEPSMHDYYILRESMGKHVIVRNMLLEILIDLQMAITSQELLEQWHKIVSSKLVTHFLDEAIHPTSMRWVMTLVGICLTYSPTYALKFSSGGGYRGLTCVLRCFFDCPEIYYILFCLIFDKPVYPRLPEVRMLDFHALVQSDGSYGELKFVELLESVIAMAKSTFDRLSMQSMLAHQTGNFSKVSASLVADLVEETTDMSGELQGEALMHKTYAARLMGGEAASPAAATSVLRFMVDLAKMYPPFSTVCRRPEFLESCVDLYFSCVRASFAVKMLKDLSIRMSNEKNNSDDNHKSVNSFSPNNQEKSVTMQKSTSTEDILALQNNLEDDKAEKQTRREGGRTVQNFECESFEEMSQGSNLHTVSMTSDATSVRDSFRSLSKNLPDPPFLSRNSNMKLVQTSSSPMPALASSPGSTGKDETKAHLGTGSSVESSVCMNGFDASQDLKSHSHGPSSINTFFSINQKLLLEIDSSCYGGGPCSAGATAVLDFIAGVLADIVSEQIKATQIVESILESVPLYVDGDSALVFQGLCLGRLMNFLDRRLLRDDEEDEQKLDKGRWSVNLDTLCWMIVDRVYMGAFPQPDGVLRTLEFLLSMLQLANKEGRIEEAAPAGKGLLSITRVSRQLESYIHTILKNTNRMILYFFLPSFLIAIGEEDFLSCLGLQIEPRKPIPMGPSPDGSAIDICTVLQLLTANKRLILCPSNLDNDLTCCLCINLISLLRSQRRSAQCMSMDIIKYLLLHRNAVIKDLLVIKQNRGQDLDVLHGGFEKLLTVSSSSFLEWFRSAEQTVNRVLEQNAGLIWVQYIAASSKFPGVKMEAMEGRRKRDMGRRSQDVMKLDLKNLEQMTERRSAVQLVRDEMSAELRFVRQDKYGWVLHAESEWQTHLQELVHERGIFPIRNSSILEPEWQLCPIEGPYRMRKKLERCKLKADAIQNAFNEQFELGESMLSKERKGNSMAFSDTDSDSFFHLLFDGSRPECFDGDNYEESSFHDVVDFEERAPTSAQISGWSNDQCSSVNETSHHSVQELGNKSSVVSLQITEITNLRSDLGSQLESSSVRSYDTKGAEDKSDREARDNGDYLIRPYLKPHEKIKYKYNCERVVGLDKHDGIFLIGELCLYVIENFYIDNSGCICEKECGDEPSVIDQALGVKKDVSAETEFLPKAESSSQVVTVKACFGGRAWAYNGGAWGKQKAFTCGVLPHLWHMWKLDSVHEILKRDYQLRPVAIEIFSMDGCNDLLVFHKKEREEVFKILVSMNLPRNSLLDTTISGSSKPDSNEGSRLFKIMAKSFSKRWQNGEISNFQYLMHLNTLAGRGYNDLTQYPVFPWVLSDYESESLDLEDPKTFRKLDKPMGCQTEDGEEEFKKRYESWDDPDVPKFHYGSHYSSAGIVLFYLLRLAPFSAENLKLQGGQFDHADRLFSNVRDTWLSASGKGNTSDVKELIPEFFYMPEFLENRFNLDLGEKQSGEKVGDVALPPWARGSPREFIMKHRAALESIYVSENLHHWIDLIFGYKQRGKAAKEAVNVFYHYTYEGSVDIDAVSDPAMKASILAQINHFGQTPKQLFLKPHVKRQSNRKLPPHPLRHSIYLVSQEIRISSSPIAQIVTINEKIVLASRNNLLKPRSYTKYISWGFPDRSLRFMSYDQEKLLSTHESLHGGNQIQCARISHDGHILVTGGDDGVVSVWRISQKGSTRNQQNLHLKRSLCAHTAKITCLYVSQPYTLIISGSDDCTVILWDLSSLVFVKQLPEFPAPISAIYVNDLTGEIVTAAGILLAIWSINGDCLAMVNTSQLPSDLILSVTNTTFSDWLETNWFVTGHQSGAIKVWHMVHCSDEVIGQRRMDNSGTGELTLSSKAPEYRLALQKVLKYHNHSVTALHLASDLKQLLSGDSGGHLISWTIPDEILRASFSQG